MDDNYNRTWTGPDPVWTVVVDVGLQTPALFPLTCLRSVPTLADPFVLIKQRGYNEHEGLWASVIMQWVLVAVLSLAAVGCGAVHDGQSAALWAGVGSYDITGPAADEGTMGYAILTTTTHGINMRLRARAYSFAESETCVTLGAGVRCRRTAAASEDGILVVPSITKRAVIVQVEHCMIFTSVRAAVVDKLRAIFPDERYTYSNVLLSATHTHSAPGGISAYVLYNVTTLGFNKKNWKTIVDGIVAAIVAADKSLQPAVLSLGTTNITGANISRSAPAYMMNPLAEREKYAADVDREMTVLRIDGVGKEGEGGGNPIGLISWFPVHGVSLNNTNTLISSDNKGFAAQLWEKDMSGGKLPGPRRWVLWPLS